MVLATPNYFDEFTRIRTPSLPYDPVKDYTTIIRQLKAACRAFSYAGASPQNLVAPAELLPVIVIRQKDRIRTFVRPQITVVEGGRIQLDACGNIYLMHGTQKAHLLVTVRRPRKLKLSYVTQGGLFREEWFFDPVTRGQWPQSVCSFICHESAHLRGELIVDNARERFVNLRKMLEKSIGKNPEADMLLKADAYRRMPLALIRKGEGYTLRHGSELRSVPEVSPDAVFFDGVDAPYEEIPQMRVPRDGELLPIRLSRFLKRLLS